MSILTEINRLKTAKIDIINAIRNKDVSVDDTTTMDNIAAYISQIETGFDSALSATQPVSQKDGDFWLKIK